MNSIFFLIILAAIAGGSALTFTKVALEVFPPFTVVTLRFFFALLVLLPIAYKKRLISVGSFKKLLLISLIGTLNPVLSFLGLQFTKASVAPVLFAAIPLMTVIYIALKEKRGITLQKLIGLIIGFLGIAFIILLPFF